MNWLKQKNPYLKKEMFGWTLVIIGFIGGYGKTGGLNVWDIIVAAGFIIGIVNWWLGREYKKK